MFSAYSYDYQSMLLHEKKDATEFSLAVTHPKHTLENVLEFQECMMGSALERMEGCSFFTSSFHLTEKSSF